MLLASELNFNNNRIIVIDALLFELGSLVAIRSGYPFRGPLAEVDAGGVLVAQMKDVDSLAGLRWDTVVRAELTGRKEPDWLQAGDILFVPRGHRFFASSIGTPPDFAVCGPHLLHLRIRAGASVTPEFLAWQINQPPIQRQLRVAAEGSSQLSVRIGETAALRVAVPSVVQQIRIVALADAAARERRLLTQLIQNRDQELAAVANALAQAAGLGAN